MRGIRLEWWLGLACVWAGCGLVSPNGGVPAGQPIPGISMQPSAATGTGGTSAAKPSGGAAGASTTAVMTAPAMTSKPAMSMAAMAMMTMLGMDMTAMMSTMTSGATPKGDAPTETSVTTGGMSAPMMPTASGGAMSDAGGMAVSSGGAGGGMAAGGTMCPAEACDALPELPDQAKSMGYTLDPCCTPEGQCGFSRDKGMTCEFIPDSDPQCPMLEVMGFKVASCCTEDGKCGLNGKAFMMKDCGSLEEAIDMFGTFITFPDPRPCTPGMTPMMPTTMPTDPMTPPTM